MRKIFVTLTAALVLLFSVGLKNASANNYIGAYPGPDASWTETDTRYFLQAFDGHGYYDQWYWSDNAFYNSQNNSYVDWEDFAYYAGHGNQYYISNISGGNTDLSIAGNTSNGGWGDGYLKYIVFDSCMVVPSPIERPNDWWVGWTNAAGGVYDGVLQILGYRTERYIATKASKPFGKKVQSGGYVFYSWLDAVSESTTHPNGLDYAAIAWCPGSNYDVYPTSMSQKCSGGTNILLTYQY